MCHETSSAGIFYPNEEALNISFEADFENTSKTFQTFDKLSETESEFPADFPSESVNNNIMLETILECSSSEKS